jgi:DNA-binding LacI/PurR family transcriptional regulator
MSDVAREAGVSLMTVSRVINNKGDVSSETRQRVLEIISELGYRPSAIARSLATKETSTIGLVAAQDSLDTVNLDNDRCGRIAAEHLVRSGHKRIGTVSGPPASYSGAGRRRRGFLAALREAGIELLEGRIRPCQPSVEGGHEATRRLLGMHPRLTALFCFNDLVAVGGFSAYLPPG